VTGFPSESAITFGGIPIEHIKPKSKFLSESLDPSNLALACALCNNAKRDFWDADTPLLNPYTDDPDQQMLALGCYIVRRPSNNRARLTIDQLDLNRQALLERRKERIEQIAPLVDQYMQEPSGSIKDLIRREPCRQANQDAEYAMIVRAYLEAVCSLDCV
jgi:hypothetical protein